MDMKWVGKGINSVRSKVNSIKSNIDSTLHKRAMKSAFKANPRGELARRTQGNNIGLSERIANNSARKEAESNMISSMKQESIRDSGAIVPYTNSTPLNQISNQTKKAAQRKEFENQLKSSPIIGANEISGNTNAMKLTPTRQTDQLMDLRNKTRKNSSSQQNTTTNNILTGDYKKYGKIAGGGLAVGGLGYALSSNSNNKND